MKRKITITIILSIIAVVFFCLNLCDPYYDDDIWYALRYIPGETLSPITHFGDIIESQYHHYMGENSRAIIHITLQTLLSLVPEQGFDLINTVVFILLVYMTALCAQGYNTPIKPLTILLSVVAIYTLLPDMDYLFYWAAGSLNYMWTSVTSLLFLLIWQHINENYSRSKWHIVILILVAFLCAFGHEAFSLPIGATILIYMLTHYRRIGFNSITLIAIAYGLGCMALLIAPGVANKTQHIDYTSVSQYISSLAITLRHLRAIPIGIAIMLACCCKKKWRNGMAMFIKENSILFMTTCIAFLFAAIVGADAQVMRIFYACEFFAMLLLLRFVYRTIDIYSCYVQRAIAIVTICSIAVWCTIVLPTASCNGQQHRQLFKEYVTDPDGIIYLSSNNAPTQPWVTNLLNLYYNSPNAEWRNFVIPLRHLNDTLAIPSPLLDRNNDYSYKLYDKYIKVLPSAIEPAIESPQKFFTPQNKVAGDNPFYITTDSCYVISPLDSLPDNSQWQWLYQPASRHDKSASIAGKIKRWVAPHTYPSSQPIQWCDTVVLPNNLQYIVIATPQYRTLRGIAPL